MKQLIVKPFMRTEWDAAIEGLSGGNLLQTWEYGVAKSQSESWRVERGTYVDGDRVLGAFQAFVRPLPLIGGGLAWVNRGPLVLASDNEPNTDLYFEVLQALRRHLVETCGLYLRVAPPLALENLGAQFLDVQGFHATTSLGWASACIDLSQDEETLRSNLHGKWRNALSKAEQWNLAIEEGTDDQMFASFLRGHQGMLNEKGLESGIPVSFLEALRESTPADRQMVVFSVPGDGVPLGSILIARFGNRCEYLAGNFSDEGRRLNAGQALIWRAIRRMKELNAQVFDVGGMDPERTPRGIFRFKDRMGGVPYRLSQELEAGGNGLIGRCVRWRVERARARS